MSDALQHRCSLCERSVNPLALVCLTCRDRLDGLEASLLARLTATEQAAFDFAREAGENLARQAKEFRIHHEALERERDGLRRELARQDAVDRVKDEALRQLVAQLETLLKRIGADDP